MDSDDTEKKGSSRKAYSKESMMLFYTKVLRTYPGVFRLEDDELYCTYCHVVVNCKRKLYCVKQHMRTLKHTDGATRYNVARVPEEVVVQNAALEPQMAYQPLLLQDSVSSDIFTKIEVEDEASAASMYSNFENDVGMNSYSQADDAGMNSYSQADAGMNSQADAELFSALCEIDHYNYRYLFERCKEKRVNARQLRYLQNEHIRELIPATELGILAEFQHCLKEWQNIKGFGKFLQTFENSVQKNSKHEETIYDDLPKDSPSVNLPMQSKFLLSEIITTTLSKLKQIFKENNGVLFERDRRFLASKIIDYFFENNLPFRLQIYESLAQQIAEEFPTECKDSWFDRNNGKYRGRLYVRWATMNRDRNNKRKLENQNEASCSSSTTPPNSCKRAKGMLVDADLDAEIEELDELEEEEGLQIQNRLSHLKLDNFQLALDLWEKSFNYRRNLLRTIRSSNSDNEHFVNEILDEWPAYRWPEGHQLLAIDYNCMHPDSMNVLQETWPIFMNKISILMEAELKGAILLDTFKQYRANKQYLNEDSLNGTIMMLLPGILKPTGWHNRGSGPAQRFSIADSQNATMRLISHISDANDYNEPYPCIFLVGASIMAIKECYVVYKSLSYKLSFLECLTTMQHFYRVFALEFPKASKNFWYFVSSYLFGLEYQQGLPSPVKTLIKFMTTYNVAT